MPSLTTRLLGTLSALIVTGVRPSTGQSANRLPIRRPAYEAAAAAATTDDSHIAFPAGATARTNTGSSAASAGEFRFILQASEIVAFGRYLSNAIQHLFPSVPCLDPRSST